VTNPFDQLQIKRNAGKKLLVLYITANVRDDWLDVIDTVINAGADAIEIGIPFSDPVMDGPVIQAASQRALARGTTPELSLKELVPMHFEVPLAVMTYYNLVHHYGLHQFAEAMSSCGATGAILPDLPMEESEPWRKAAEANDVANIMLVAPTTPDERLARIAELSQGFVYAVGTMGVTGERESLAATAGALGKRAKAVTDKPVLIGVGVSNPDQARQAAESSDGVIVGTALMRRILDGASLNEIADFVGQVRTAL
jgi:tryptophan synthase alpha chain